MKAILVLRTVENHKTLNVPYCQMLLTQGFKAHRILSSKYSVSTFPLDRLMNRERPSPIYPRRGLEYGKIRSIYKRWNTLAEMNLLPNEGLTIWLGNFVVLLRLFGLRMIKWLSLGHPVNQRVTTKCQLSTSYCPTRWEWFSSWKSSTPQLQTQVIYWKIMEPPQS